LCRFLTTRQSRLFGGIGDPAIELFEVAVEWDHPAASAAAISSTSHALQRPIVLFTTPEEQIKGLSRFAKNLI